MTEPIPPIPPEIVPHGVDPGLPDNHHRKTGTMGIFRLIIAMCLFGGAFFCLMGYAQATSKYQSSHSVGLFMIALMGIPSFITGFGLWWWHKNQTSMEVWTTPRGIAWKSDFKQGFAKWDDVAKHYRLVMEVYHQGRHLRTNIWLTLETTAGVRIVFRDFVRYVLDLANRIDAEIAKRQLAPALTRAHAGEALHFDKLGISTAGISWKGATLPWSEVESIETEFGYMTIRKKGKWLSWARFAVGDIPNFPVFSAVLQAVRAAAPAPSR